MNSDTRDSFFGKLYELAKADKDIIFISADADTFTLKQFRDNLPEQYISAGVAEQNVVLMAAGLAMGGKKVFIYSIIPFITMRCYEQIKVNICSMNLDVTIVGIGAGYSFSWEGPTHHGVQDLALMRTLPTLSIFNPNDSVSSEQSALQAYTICSPCYVRLDKGIFPKIYNEEDCKIGLKIFSNKNKIKIITTGYTTHLIRDLLNKNNLKEIDIIDLFRVKPINESLLISSLMEGDHIITLEENSKIGGIGSIICELVADNKMTAKIHRFALDDTLLEKYGDRIWLMQQSGLDLNLIISKVKEIIN